MEKRGVVKPGLTPEVRKPAKKHRKEASAAQKIHELEDDAVRRLSNRVADSTDR